MMSADMRPDLMTLDGVGEKPCASTHDVHEGMPGVYNLLHTRACLNAVIKLAVAWHRHAPKGDEPPNHTRPWSSMQQ